MLVARNSGSAVTVCSRIIQSLLLYSCVSLGKSLGFSEPSSPHLQNGPDGNNLPDRMVWRIKCDNRDQAILCAKDA